VSGRITLHPKFGVNPSLGTCFWCGGDSGEVLLLGYNKGKEAPRRMVASYAPCPKCVENRAKGITLIEVVPSRSVLENDPQDIAPGHRPTGRWMVMSEDWARTFIYPAQLRDDVLKKRMAFVEPQTIDALNKANEDLQKEGES
jgi:hypothetical protein